FAVRLHGGVSADAARHRLRSVAALRLPERSADAARGGGRARRRRAGAPGVRTQLALRAEPAARDAADRAAAAARGLAAAPRALAWGARAGRRARPRRPGRGA